jgi:Lipopolysaccharide kinase (Kdo/WaaP) family
MRSHQTKTDFLRRETLTRCAIVDPNLPRDLIELLWLDPEAVIRRGEILRRTGVRRTVHLNWGPQRYVVKHYRPTWWHFVRQLPLRSWASATFEVAQRLIDAGIATPRPVAYVENRWGSLRRDSFLLYEYVEGVTLQTYLFEEGKQTNTLAENISRQIRDFWQRIEDLRIGLADAHTGNFIVCPAGQLWIIDLDKTRFHRWQQNAVRNQQLAWEKFVHTSRTSGPIRLDHVRSKRAA